MSGPIWMIRIFPENWKVLFQKWEPLSPKVHYDQIRDRDDGYILPALVICDRDDGRDLGAVFHAVPGGHEFNSFIIALYNASGPGQPLEPRSARL